MKIIKFLVVLSVFLLNLTLSTNIYAIEPTPSTKPTVKRQQVREMVVENKTEIVEKISAVRKTRILDFSNKMVVRIEATVDRIEKLISRIEARITKIESTESDINIETTKESLDEAKQKLALVKIEISTLKSNLETMLEADEPKKVFEEVKNSLDKIKDGLKEVHELLVKVIGEIKGLRVGDTR